MIPGSEQKGMVLGIDASRNRSGGAIAYLKGIIEEGAPSAHGIGEVHLWSYGKLLDALPDRPWLVKHNPPALEKSVLHQIWWQFRSLPKEARRAGCDVLFATDATTVSTFMPLVVMSQDMLSYEPGVMGHFGFTRARLRLIAILFVQNRAMRLADGVIFLSEYAARVIQQSTGKLDRVRVIPHGIDPEFRQGDGVRQWPAARSRPIRCLYVSNAAMYKNQWIVVRAAALLRGQGYDLQLILAGGGAGRAQQLLDDEIAKQDPQGAFVKTLGFVPHDGLPALLGQADLFVFASSCENLPVTLLEAMASGLPIACSNRGPMPEVLGDGGVYFNPEDANSVASAMEKIITDEHLRQEIANRARKLSEKYSWAGCAAGAWDFMKTVRGVTEKT